jgi:hypothetical protein
MEVSVLLGCDAASKTFWPLKMTPLHCLQMSGTKYPLTQRHIPEELVPYKIIIHVISDTSDGGWSNGTEQP